MEIYCEVINAGNLDIEISVRKKNHRDENSCWVHCTARNTDGRILWQTSLTDDDGTLKHFHNVEQALQETRAIFSVESDDHEFQGLANKELDKNLYFLSLM